jgi:hypothetical protein
MNKVFIRYSQILKKVASYLVYKATTSAEGLRKYVATIVPKSKKNYVEPRKK